MRVPHAEVRHEICDSIKSLYSPVESKQSVDGMDWLSNIEAISYIYLNKQYRLTFSKVI